MPPFQSEVHVHAIGEADHANCAHLGPPMSKTKSGPEQPLDRNTTKDASGLTSLAESLGSVFAWLSASCACACGFACPQCQLVPGHGAQTRAQETGTGSVGGKLCTRRPKATERAWRTSPGGLSTDFRRSNLHTVWAQLVTPLPLRLKVGHLYSPDCECHI